MNKCGVLHVKSTLYAFVPDLFNRETADKTAFGKMLYTVICMNPNELPQVINHTPIDSLLEDEMVYIEPVAAAETSSEHHDSSHHEIPQKKTITNPQTLYSWVAPLRAYKKKPVGVLRFYFAVAILLTIIVVFLREYMLTIPIWSTIFLIYALTITPPHDAEHTVTKFGLHTGAHTYPWGSLSHFYFIKKFDYHLLVVFTKQAYGHPLYLVIPNETVKHEVLHLLAEHLVYQESPEKTFADKMAEWLTTLMPEEESQTPDVKHEEQPHERHMPVTTEERPHQHSQQPHQALWQEQ